MRKRSRCRSSWPLRSKNWLNDACDGDAGGGLVQVTVSGSGELVGLTIDSAAVDPDDTETLADLVLAAYRDAANKATAMQQEAMNPIAQGLGGFHLPGL